MAEAEAETKAEAEIVIAEGSAACADDPCAGAEVTRTLLRMAKKKKSAALCPREPALRTVMMPRDTNPLGSIFGGRILSLIDLAAGQHARSIAPKRYVTKVMREVEFIAPVYVGDAVSFYTETIRIGKTSINVRVDVEALRGFDALQRIKVTSAEVVMVAVDDKIRPIPILPK